jgi:Carboxypeptidase regulatory-like domain
VRVNARPWILCLVTLAGAHVAFAQVAPAGPPAAQAPARDAAAKPSTGTARLSGRVLAADTGKPLRRAFVLVAPAGLDAVQLQLGRLSRSVSTDADGRWTLTALPSGQYQITVSKGGYVSLQFGQRRPYEQGRPVDLTPGQSVERLDVVLPRAAAISGRITDELGEPITHAFVTVSRRRFVDGQRVVAPVSEGIQALLSGGLTDDMGRYRIYGLSPATYYVSAMTDASPPGSLTDQRRRASTFFPGVTAMADAEPVTIDVGQEADASFSVREARTVNVSGTVRTAGGEPGRGSVSLLGMRPMPSDGTLVARIAVDGSFTVANVASGEYRAHAQLTGTTPIERGSQPVMVGDQDLSGLLIVTSPGAIARGRVTFDEPASAPAGRVTLEVFPAAPVPDLAGRPYPTVNVDRTFEVRDLHERNTFRLGPIVPDGWELSSVRIEGADVTDSGYAFKPGETVNGVEVILTRRLTRLTGSVRKDRQVVDDCTVVVFSADPRFWGYRTRHVKAARPNQDGTFVVTGLPPGDYLAVALEYLEPGDEQDPELLEKWRRNATRVTLEAGQSTTVTIDAR